MADFEWDDLKAEANLAKHRISFEDAISIFSDPDLMMVATIREADREERYKALGRIGPRLFVVVYVERPGATRIISARRANAQEERQYGDRQTDP